MLETFIKPNVDLPAEQGRKTTLISSRTLKSSICLLAVIFLLNFAWDALREESIVAGVPLAFQIHLVFGMIYLYLVRKNGADVFVTEHQLHIDYNEHKSIINRSAIGDIQRYDLISQPNKIFLFVILWATLGGVGVAAFLFSIHSEQVHITDKNKQLLASFPISIMNRRRLKRAL